MHHTFVALVADRPGVLTRVASLLRRLNYNIVSLAVGRSEKAGVSRMTIVAEAPPASAHRITAAMYKLEDVMQVDNVGRRACVIVEMALIKVAANAESRSRLFELAKIYRARIVDLAPESMMLEITAGESKIEGLLELLQASDHKVLEVSRSGRMAMRRGHHTSRVLDALDDSGTQTDFDVSMGRVADPTEEAQEELHKDLLGD
jgi:acetolactate synthase-1/3 small subunit